jgi:hypothetical protein
MQVPDRRKVICAGAPTLVDCRGQGAGGRCPRRAEASSLQARESWGTWAGISAVRLRRPAPLGAHRQRHLAGGAGGQVSGTASAVTSSRSWRAAARAAIWAGRPAPRPAPRTPPAGPLPQCRAGPSPTGPRRPHPAAAGPARARGAPDRRWPGQATRRPGARLPQFQIRRQAPSPPIASSSPASASGEPSSRVARPRPGADPGQARRTTPSDHDRAAGAGGPSGGEAYAHRAAVRQAEAHQAGRRSASVRRRAVHPVAAHLDPAN